jgi:hypothetical protein
MLSGCYTWEAKCLTFPNPCTQTQQAQSCAEPACWFWILAAAVGIALVLEKR